MPACSVQNFLNQYSALVRWSLVRWEASARKKCSQKIRMDFMKTGYRWAIDPVQPYDDANNPDFTALHGVHGSRKTNLFRWLSALEDEKVNTLLAWVQPVDATQWEIQNSTLQYLKMIGDFWWTANARRRQSTGRFYLPITNDIGLFCCLLVLIVRI